jgi:hypothetical protein
MGLQEVSHKQYLSVGFGRIRKKCNPDDPKAIERMTQKGEKTYAIEYKSIEGVLEDITFRDDPQYGKSWSIHIRDIDQVFCVQIPEQSRYATDLLKKIPNLHRGMKYKFTPYDYEKNRKRKVGLAIDSTTGKIESFYQKFTGNEAEGWKVENLHEYPTYDGDPKDEDELKIYFTRTTKFLRIKAFAYLESHEFTVIPTEEISPEVEKEKESDDDGLPF